ncbi:MAG: hypothetical protein LUC88_00975 [Prevotella sp.]|nr:hypothetical protein [Prevotella sp.]
MEYISLIIRFLFQEIPLNRIDRLDRDWVIRFLRDMSPNLTLDQLENLWNLAQEYWFIPKEDGELMYLENSLFNILLHFSEKVLNLKEPNPLYKYKYVTDWHELTRYLGEDIFVMSALAAYDIKKGIGKRHNFPWGEQIDIDNENNRLNELLETKDIAELHSHLNASSYNFSLSWISAMNQVRVSRKAKKAFKFSLDQSPTDDDYYEGIEIMLIKAAAIRFLLFYYNYDNNNVDRNLQNLVNKIIDSKSKDEICSFALELKNEIDCISFTSSYKCKLPYNIPNNWSFTYKDATIDYALPAKTTFTDMMDCLKSERLILYNSFYRIFSSEKDRREIEKYLYLYLLIKSKFRKEYIQCNGKIGFSNFQDYEKRKVALYERGIYCHLNSLLSVGSYFYKYEEHRYLETRISPKETSGKIVRSLQKINNAVCDENFGGNKGLRYKFIFHFIKNKEEKPKRYEIACLRNNETRKKVFRQATSIVRLCKCRYCEDINTYIVGTDAASSEIGCRPEVFAQAYRFLRGYNNDAKEKMPRLGFTYHVGEDLIDIVDGLRAVDEAIMFLGLKKGDRIGHGLVLGIDVRKYYERLNHKVVMPCQMLLDNIVWLYFMIGKCRFFSRHLIEKLKSDYEDFFFRIYDETAPRIKTYYNSWRLRGNCPHNKLTYDFGWNQYANDQNNLVKEIKRTDEQAVELYKNYYLSASVQTNGAILTEYEISQEMVEAIVKVQRKMLNKVKKLKIHIECNPTSNVLIGGMAGYETHPITKFNNKHLKKRPFEISVSINTDDKGIFSTSLEREYSVMAAALEKSGYKKKRVDSWIENVMDMGWENRFS